jgi:hypothetical protein
VALIGRGWGLIHGSRGVRKPKERDCARMAVARFQVEQLETRALLASGPFQEASQLLPIGVYAPSAAISFESSFTPSAGRQAALLDSLDQADTTYAGPVHLTAIAGDWSGSLIVFGPNVPVIASAHDPVYVESLHAAFQISGSSAYAAPEEAGSAPPGWVGVGIVGPSGAGFFAARSSPSDALDFGPGLAGIGISIPGAATYGGGTSGPNSPSGYHEGPEALVFPGRAFLAMPQSPFELASESYGFPFHVFAEPGQGSVLAFSAGGTTESVGISPGEFAQFMGAVASPVPAFGLAARGALSVGHTAVQFSSSASQAATEAGAFAGSTALNWSIPIAVSAQRLEGQDPALSISDPVQAALSGRATNYSLSTLTGMSSITDSDGPVPTSVADATVLWAPDGSSPAITVTADTPSSSSGGFTFRITAGPFVSRNAGPLGPILASVGRDPTPEVDRNERTRYQNIEHRDFGAIDDGATHDYGLTGPGEDQAVDGVDVISGPGGFPVKVTALSRHRRTDLSELVSAIQAPVERASADAIDSTEPAAAAEASSPANAPVYAHFIKAACVLAFGLGMSSRAIFPSLLTTVRRRLPRSFAHRKSDPRKS